MQHGLGPSIAVLTNIYEDHLTHYNGFEDYASTKRSIATTSRPMMSWSTTLTSPTARGSSM